MKLKTRNSFKFQVIFMQKETAKSLIQKTIRDYSKIAADFSATRSFTWQIMQEFVEFVKPGDNVLDFGCGNGRLLDALSVGDIVYKGVDPVPEFIDIARQKYMDVTAFDQSARGRATKIKRSIEFKVADFDVDNFRLDFPDKYFDHIFAVAVFHHLPSVRLREDVLKEFKRVLKDDGYIFLTVWNLWKGKGLRATIKFFFAKIFAIIKDISVDNILLRELDFGDLFISYTTASKNIKVQRYHHAFTKREIVGMANRAGLKSEKVFYDKKKFNICAIIRKV